MSDNKYMHLALRLAQKGIGSVEPNPAVGCVIVKDDRVIGKGWHRKFGGPHAEINALADCQEKGFSPAGSEIYITLEPCCHYGKTPPCVDAIIAAQPAKAIIAMIDPFEKVSGRSVELLRKAGIDVEVGLCGKEAELLNATFIKFAKTGKCWVILKWAQSIDGKLAYADKTKQQWISNEKSRRDIHKLRRRAQAILVGVNTVIADNPLLTARPSKGKRLVRVVLDANLRIPINCRLLRTAKKSPLLIASKLAAIEANLETAEQIKRKGAELFPVPAINGYCDLQAVVGELSKRGVSQLLVEGGPTVITSFLKQKLADEICVYIAPKLLGSQGGADITKSMEQITETVSLHNVETIRFGDDTRLSGLVGELT